MTNLEAKQEAIKKAYGEYWNRLSDLQKEYALNNNGNVHIGYSKEESQLYKDMVKSNLFLTQPLFPKSLLRINTNNEWIRIESKYELPRNQNIDIIIFNKCYQGYIYNGLCYVENRYNSPELDEIVDADCITHYQPIEKPKPPIY